MLGRMTARLAEVAPPGSRADKPAAGARARGRHDLVVLVGALLVFGWNSWRPAWSGDEAATVLAVRRSTQDLLRTAWHDPALEPYYLLLKPWASISTSEFWLRLPSLLAMAAAVVLLRRLVSRLADDRTALLAAAVMIVLPATSRYAHDARPYAMSVLLVVAIVLVWQDARSRRGLKILALLSGLLVLLGLMHAYALLIVPVLVLTSLVAPQSDLKEEVAAIAKATAAAVVLLSPFLALVALRANGQNDPAPVTPVNVVEEFLRLPVGVLSPLLAPAAAIALVIVAAGGMWLAARGGATERHCAVLTAAWLVLPPLALCALQLSTGSPGLVTRYWLFSVPPLAIAAGVAIHRLLSFSAAAGTGLLVALIVLSLPTHAWIRGVDGHLGQRWRELPTLLDLPGLRAAPLLAKGWNYRGLVSNGASVRTRMPLVIDPTSAGRINPLHASTASAAYRDLLMRTDRVVALHNGAGSSAALPTKQSFPDLASQLQAFPRPIVFCRFFGAHVGVFAKETGVSSPAQAAELASQIKALAPEHVRCSAGGG